MSSPFGTWVGTADAVRATTKKLEKQRLLGDYLHGLDDTDQPESGLAEQLCVLRASASCRRAFTC